MESEKEIAFLREQVAFLEQEKAAAIESLWLADSLGRFESSYSQQSDPELIMAEICRRARTMVPFHAASVYLIDEDSHDLGQRFVDGQDLAEALHAELESLIRDQSFAYALQVGAACFFRAKNGTSVLLHPLSTATRVRGMFVGFPIPERSTIADTTLALFTVVMNAGAHALESYELNMRFREHQVVLENTIKERTAQLNESVAQLSTVLDSIQVGVMIVDAESCTIMDMNRAGLAMLGVTNKGEVVGREYFRFVCPANKGSCPVLDQGRSVDNSERILLAANGMELPILKTVATITLDGKPCLVEAFMDITERKNLEKLKDDVERIMHHDLKSPLNGIIGLPEIILDTVALNDEDRELVEAIRDSGLRMLRLINMSTDMYKMETGTYNYRPNQVNLATLLRSILLDSRSIASAKRLTINVLLEGDPVDLSTSILVKGEELLLHSLLANLLKNALEASPPGETVTVRITKGSCNKIAIFNEGTLAANIRSSFFEKYASFGKKGGTGLGTYSARLIARTMGGDISLEPETEPGVCVVVSLPS